MPILGAPLTHAAASERGVQGFRVVIPRPDGGVTPPAAHGLGCFGGNVGALRVAGSFDACQRLVKQAFADTDLRALFFSSRRRHTRLVSDWSSDVCSSD